MILYQSGREEEKSTLEECSKSARSLDIIVTKKQFALFAQFVLNSPELKSTGSRRKPADAWSFLWLI